MSSNITHSYFHRRMLTGEIDGYATEPAVGGELPSLVTGALRRRRK